MNFNLFCLCFIKLFLTRFNNGLLSINMWAFLHFNFTFNTKLNCHTFFLNQHQLINSFVNASLHTFQILCLNKQKNSKLNWQGHVYRRSFFFLK